MFRYRFYSFLAVALALFVTAAWAHRGPAVPRNLNEDEAKELVIMSLNADTRKLPKLTLSAEKGLGAQGFYYFVATADTPGSSPVIGHFSVNQATGDVWDSVWCTRRTSDQLTRLQKKIRQKAHVTDEQLAASSALSPCPR